MTCEECQPLAIDLARGLPPLGVGEAVQRGDVLSHIARCKRCAEWLAKQEALTEALRAAAEADARLSAPPGVEANVMAAFRARQVQRYRDQGHREQRQPAGASLAGLGSSARSTTTSETQPDARHADATQRHPDQRHPEQRHPEQRHREQGHREQRQPEQWHEKKPQPFATQQSSSRLAWPMWAYAAAAAVVIVALSLVSLRSLNTPPDPRDVPDGASRLPDAQDAPDAAVASGTRQGSAATPVGAPVTGTNAAVVEVLPEKGEKRSKGRPVPPRGVVRREVIARRLEAGPGSGRGPETGTGTRTGPARGGDTRRGSNAARAVNASRGSSELGGPAFVLLPYAEPLRPTEMRHIMRVRMSRAMAAAGDARTENVDGATVLADVLVGEDGMARAVRIVQ